MESENQLFLEIQLSILQKKKNLGMCSVFFSCSQRSGTPVLGVTSDS